MFHGWKGVIGERVKVEKITNLDFQINNFKCNNTIIKLQGVVNIMHSLEKFISLLLNHSITIYDTDKFSHTDKHDGIFLKRSLNRLACCRPACVFCLNGVQHIVDSLAPSQCSRVSYSPFLGPLCSPRPLSFTRTACVQTTGSERYKGPGLFSLAISTGEVLLTLHTAQTNPPIRTLSPHSTVFIIHT